jgi:hypothetical protein
MRRYGRRCGWRCGPLSGLPGQPARGLVCTALCSPDMPNMALYQRIRSACQPGRVCWRAPENAREMPSFVVPVVVRATAAINSAARGILSALGYR